MALILLIGFNQTMEMFSFSKTIWEVSKRLKKRCALFRSDATPVLFATAFKQSGLKFDLAVKLSIKVEALAVEDSANSAVDAVL